MKIRSIKKSEVATASKLVGLNYSKNYEKSSKKEIGATFTNSVIPPKYLVAEEKGKVIGFGGYIQSWMDYSVYNIFWVNVHPKEQGKGIGTKLVRALIDKIKGAGSKKNPPRLILITATTENTRFYEKRFGFKKMFFFDDYHLMGLGIK